MSNISHLAERLKSQIQHEQQEIENQTSDALKKHSESLKRLSSDALNTTRSAIKSESETLIQSIRKAHSLTEQQISRLPRLLLVSMLWPIMGTAAVCLLMIGLTWLYLPTELFTAKTETWRLQGANGQPVLATVIIDQSWTVCTDKGEQRPCKIQQP